MSAATKAKPAVPFFTGWCGLRLPAESHSRCRRDYGDQRCLCSCYQVELMPLPDALAQLCQAVCGTSGRHDPICQTVRHHLTSEPGSPVPADRTAP